jgi:multicomponent Na+:H+ antiporter subunit D
MIDFFSNDFINHPGIILILGGIAILFMPGNMRRIVTFALPILALAGFLSYPDDLILTVNAFGYTLDPIRIDGLSWIFTLIFIIAAFIAAVYSLHSSNKTEQSTIAIYAGSAIGAVLAGDLLTLFIFWEISALSSTIIVWAGGGNQARQAGMRYLLIHITSGLLLMLGSILHYQQTESMLFNAMTIDTLSGLLIFLAFGIKCAFPLMHNWLQDAYPQASPVGTVALSAFTTKLAVYCLARAYAGTESLIWIGAIMTAFPIFFAVIENDLRKVLSYSLNNQLGFMVVGVGIGTELALNGTAAHAFSHILYKALLFMSMGAVLHRVGTVKASELGGLYKSMPWTTIFCIIGAMSISAFPLFSGFISKGIILYAVAEEGHWMIWLVLLFASAGVLDHSGIKVPFFSFFAHDQNHKCKEAPLNMLLAMGMTAAACILIGVFPNLLYQWLPHEMDFHPYTFDHIISQLQLLFFATLAFVVLFRNGWYPAEIKSVNLDFDWFYRKPLNSIVSALAMAFGSLLAGVQSFKQSSLKMITLFAFQAHGPKSSIARGTSVGNMVLWVAVLLSACLVFYYF